MKLLRHIAILTLAGLFSSGLALCAQDSGSSKKAEEILKKAESLQKNGTYRWTSAKELGKDGSTSWAVWSQKSQASGIPCYRYESFSDGQSGYLAIRNADGEFQIYSDVAIKKQWAAARKSYGEEVAAIGESLPVQFSLSEETLKGEPCWVVSKTMQTDAAAFEKFCVALEKAFPKEDGLPPMTEERKKASFESNFPVKSIYWIAKSDGFIRKTVKVKSNGEELPYQANYDKIEINPKLDDSLFQPPKGMEVKVAKNIKEECELSSAALQRKMLHDKKAEAESKRIATERASFSYWAFLILPWFGAVCIVVGPGIAVWRKAKV